MTLYDAMSTYAEADNPQSEVSTSQMASRSATAMAWPAKRRSRPEGRWRAIAIAAGLAASVAGAEFFATYCGFSDHCSALRQIAVWPWHAAQFGPGPL
jgi:hypothetical protein